MTLARCNPRLFDPFNPGATLLPYIGSSLVVRLGFVSCFFLISNWCCNFSDELSGKVGSSQILEVNLVSLVSRQPARRPQFGDVRALRSGSPKSERLRYNHHNFPTESVHFSTSRLRGSVFGNASALVAAGSTANVTLRKAMLNPEHRLTESSMWASVGSRETSFRESAQRSNVNPASLPHEDLHRRYLRL